MNTLREAGHINRRLLISFITGLIKTAGKLAKHALFKPSSWKDLSSDFADLYSKLWDLAEHSISHTGFNLPSALGDSPSHRVNDLLLELYGGRYASLSFGGSSGALVTILTAVLPRLQKDRDLILFDDVCHQSTIGGIIFGRWKALRLPRVVDPHHHTVQPVTFTNLKKIIEANDPSRFAAIILVTPSYDGFRSPAEDQKIYSYAKANGITVIVDGAWDSVRFRENGTTATPLDAICDIWISSPHKRGLTPSSVGCIITHDATIARLWDEALDLGFRSSSVSFIEIMIAEHRLQQIINGDWEIAFVKAVEGAKYLRQEIKDIHPDLYCVRPEDVHAEEADAAHILINTHRIQNFDARQWAKILSAQFGLDVEKSTQSTLLLICASPDHLDRIEEIKSALQAAFIMTLKEIS